MGVTFDPVHIKSAKPKVTADWYVKHLGFTIVNDFVRVWGDRFIACTTSDGTKVNISADRNHEKMGDGDVSAHWGIEHIGFTVDDIESEITRLTKAGAKLMEGPIDVPNGSMRICFLATPGDVRIELLEILS